MFGSVTLELATNGIEVSFSEKGFSAFGLTKTHEFVRGEYGEDKPPISGRELAWSIHLDGTNPFETYATYAFLEDGPSPRIPVLRDYFSEVGSAPVGEMRILKGQEAVSLHYRLAADPALVTFVMGIISSRREMTIWSSGWHFHTQDEQLAPAASVEGFTNRSEPAYTLDFPALRVR